MEPGYEDFLHRIAEERERLGLRQETVAVKLGLTQSHYSKNELGKNRFSFQNLQIMSHLSFDLYYVFSGNRLKLNFGKDNTTVMEQRFFLENIFVALSEYDIYSFAPEIRVRLDYIKFVSYFSYTGDRNVFKILSLYEGMTQMRLAEQLGTDPKKLRRLERREIMPDSEIIYRIFKEFGITPLTLLEDNNAALYQADYVLRMLDVGQQTRVMAYLERYIA